MAKVESSTIRQMRRRHGQMLTVVLRDDHGARLDATFFNPYKLMSVIKPGVRALFAGQVGTFQGKPQLTHPQFEPLPDGDDVRPFLAIYPATAKLPSWKIGHCVRQVLDVLDDPTDPLPAALRKAEGLTELGRALRRIHVPETEADHHAARNRLVWDEAHGRAAGAGAAPAGHRVPAGAGLPAAAGTGCWTRSTPGCRSRSPRARSRWASEIAADLSAAHPMNRLVQGDVGAGKTVVALRAMLQVVDAGRQAALLAPTEVLAAQHARSLRALLGPLGMAGQLGAADEATGVTLLTGSLGAKARRQALLDAQSGAAGIVVGTHALIQDHVGFADLGLVVVDEQHRFGVEQRDALRGRGELAPHMLVMTATPIPRTVAMTVYGDLAVSALRELPARALADRHHRGAAGREAGLGGAGVGAGPRGGGDGAPGVRGVPADRRRRRRGGRRAGRAGRRRRADGREPPPAATRCSTSPRSWSRAPCTGCGSGILHGRLPADEKDAVMRAFERAELDVLVATTVIEVGVDVPNATGMVILDADRFGLSQLHQLRGRVGRGAAPGVCLLVTDMPPGTTARERLDAVAGTTDGFELARLDLELRREGDVLGAVQSGRRSGLRLLCLLRHEEIIAKAQALRDRAGGRRPRPARAPRAGRAGRRDRRRRGARRLPRQGLSCARAHPDLLRGLFQSA